MFQKFESLFYMVVVLSVSFVYTTGNDLKEEGRRAHRDRGGLWFGPRLGKRSNHMADENNRDVYLKLVEAADALRYYYDQLPESFLDRRNEPGTPVSKKVIFTPILGRSLDEERQVMDFTPRLGRREDTVTPSDQEIYQGDERTGSKARYFSPRLGRTMNFSPRLGRQLSYGSQTERFIISNLRKAWT